jgi:hypothetical protein
MGASELLLEVSAGGDPLREERLTRDLQNVLQSDQVLAAAGVSVVAAPPPPAHPGAKGTFEARLPNWPRGVMPRARHAHYHSQMPLASWCLSTSIQR